MTIVNTTNGPLVYSDDARTIAAGERLADVQPDDTTRTALARGYLLEIADTPASTPESAGTPTAAPGVAAPKPAG